jgi:mannose-6-phosphate isomerase-like protein (cupin superfamily)
MATPGLVYTALVTYTRRDLTLLLPSLAASAAAAPNSPLASQAYRFEDLPVRASGPARQRRILEGQTHTGLAIELHHTEMPAGEASHASHRHAHDELLLIRDGTVEVTIAGRTTKLGPGSVAYIASNDDHGLRNVGATPAQYFALALGREK